MNRATTGMVSKSKLVWNDEFDGREFNVPTELFGKNSSTPVMLGQGILSEHQRFIDHDRKAALA
jgi:hypothetical protein